jgi:hypothetical protein
MTGEDSKFAQRKALATSSEVQPTPQAGSLLPSAPPVFESSTTAFGSPARAASAT